MQLVPPTAPPLFVGAMRKKSLQLAGRVGDGTILTEMSSPAYVRWAREQITDGMAQGKRTENHVVVYVQSKIGKEARTTVREVLASRFSWADVHLQVLGIAEEVAALVREYGSVEAARRMPEAWLDDLSASGTPEQAQQTLVRLKDAGADSIILQPLAGDPACLDEYIEYLRA
jgi:alkanesulfonate monooxygenase SsuD/methylene tetrahydromethanopterin reductase-like flavin-dependent oxidoreductase (luciferase family)